jgi:ATP-dependent Lhr-like helicase
MSERVLAFERLHSSIQEVLYRKRWKVLRGIQADAIDALFDAAGDVVIAAHTASGKTEAAFLPVLSRIAEFPGASIRALYVSPLKALINDQFRRLDELCELAGIPVHRWHGDVSAGAKATLLARPAGVLLTTPESTESILINRPAHLPGLFADLEFVVIDEIHAFMGTERGVHLQSLLSRLEGYSQRRVRRIGLSATLGDMSSAQRWLSRGSSNGVLVVGGAAKAIQLRVHGFVSNPGDEEEEEGGGSFVDVAEHLLRVLGGTSNLVFANRKADIELYADLLNRLCRKRGLPEQFAVHHGSLSKEMRESAEEEMRAERACTTLCSNTLELGIDVGELKSVAQLDPPFTVSALRQRLGRSGRGEGQPSVLRFCIREEAPDADAPLWERLYPRLLQSVAMVDLMLDRWCETPRVDKLHYSTLVQQIMSVLKQVGGANAATIYELLVGRGPFDLNRSEFAELLRSLAKHDVIEQVEGGDLILGLLGERIASHYDFYSAFCSPEEYTVVAAGRRIGQLPVDAATGAGQQVLLGAKRWRVVEIRHEQRVMLVEPCGGARPPRFAGGGGDVDRLVRRTMRQVLLRGELPRYLDRGASAMLEQASGFAQLLQLDSLQLLSTGGGTCVLPWDGDRVVRTLTLMLNALGVRSDSFHIAIHCQAPIDAVADGLFAIAQDAVHVGRLLDTVPLLEVEKYDRFVPLGLQRKSFARNWLDMEGAKQCALSMLSEDPQVRRLSPR